MNKIQKIESRLLRVIKRCLRNWKRKQKKKQVRKSRKRVRTRREIQTRKTSGKVAQRKTGKTGSQHRQSQVRRKNERKIQEKRRQFILKTAAFAAVGVLSAAGVFLVKKLTIQAEASSAKSVETVVEKAQEENTRQYMYGIESIISGVCISQDTDSEVNKLGTSCEAVLVGQRVGKNQQESNLDFSKAAADTVEKLENHSLDVEQYLKVTDRDYETLLKIVEAEAGGEDTEEKSWWRMLFSIVCRVRFFQTAFMILCGRIPTELLSFHRQQMEELIPLLFQKIPEKQSIVQLMEKIIHREHCFLCRKNIRIQTM